MNRNLFEIQDEYLQYLEELEQYLIDNPDAEGEIPEHINERLNINKDEASQKLTNFYLWRMELEGQVDTLKQRRDQLSDKIKIKRNVIERIKGYIDTAVRMYGTVNLKSTGKIPSKVIHGEEVTFTYIYSPKIIVTDVNQIPDGFLRYSIEVGNMSKAEFEVLKLYVTSRDLGSQEEINVNTKAVQVALESGSPVTGVKLDKEAGYVRTS